MEKTLTASIETTLHHLRRNNMEAYYCDNSAQARDLVKTLLHKGDILSCGGSVTLKETGIYDIISGGDYRFLDRSACRTQEETEEIYRRTFSADVFLTSANAVTENGELYNVDGNSNRVAAILYGPKSVICVCGVNKLVKNLDEAIHRVKTVAAPQNTIRLGLQTPCGKTGACVSLQKENPALCEGCRGAARICCNFVVCAQQRHVNRIKVILIGETLGY